ncbi:TPA: hypothetical protein N0F65_008761 [Lagenidium giganteum]|uniref:V-SNARE coiled-coil homology domain-containing protein n=1 Tax=Lagenidium giganteum TaxID=4803 RepID=A0AAV2Z2J1_9STRA|nr:TPA: hypothetical protein N0F65_008761 [Lagenidium giganteum]
MSNTVDDHEDDDEAWRTAARCDGRCLACQAQRAYMHAGKATTEATQAFLARNNGEAAAPAPQNLRIGAEESLAITRRGVGSPYIWSKDVPRVDASKKAVAGLHSNFIQTIVNPYVDRTGEKEENKQTYAEALVLQEIMDEGDIKREELVVSALVTDSVIDPASGAVEDRLSKQNIERGVQLALDEMHLQTLDHVVCKLPAEVAFTNASTLNQILQDAAKALEALCDADKVQSYGFAFPLTADPAAAQAAESSISSALTKLTETHPRFASVQLPMSLSSPFLPLSQSLLEWKQEHKMVVIGDSPFDALLESGKPLHLHSSSSHTGEDVALLLKSAFNLAISVERKYMEQLHPQLKHLPIPPTEELAWAHILANQHGQFDNLEEWLYIRETQIMPRFQMTLQQLGNVEDTKDVGFAYSLALRELLKCFTASIELLDAARVNGLLAAVSEATSTSPSIEHVAIHAALTAGADVVLFQDQVADPSAIAWAQPEYSREQLAQLRALARPYFQPRPKQVAGAARSTDRSIQREQTPHLEQAKHSTEHSAASQPHQQARRESSMAQTPASLTKDNVKFMAIARATDKAIVCSYIHNSSRKGAADLNELNQYREMLSKVIRAPTWKSQVTPNGRHSLECDPNKFHFTMDNDELVFAAITAKDYPIRLAFQMITAVQQEIVPKFGSKALTCRENGLDKDCMKALAAIATTYDDRTKVDKISEVMNQVDAVKGVMHNNIQVVLSNTEKMEVVEQKTNDLNEQAKVFRNTGRKLRKEMWWKNVKLTILLTVCAILVLIIILAMAGVFKKSSSSDKRMLRIMDSA